MSQAETGKIALRCCLAVADTGGGVEVIGKK
jgi:hypothetical protein